MHNKITPNPKNCVDSPGQSTNIGLTGSSVLNVVTPYRPAIHLSVVMLIYNQVLLALAHHPKS